MKIHTYRAYRRFARNERSQPRDALAEGDIRRSFFFNFYIYFFIFLFFYFSPTYHRSQRYQRYQKLILAPKQKKKRKRTAVRELISRRPERISVTFVNFHHIQTKKEKKHPASYLTHAFSPSPCTCLHIGSIGTSVKGISSFSRSQMFLLRIFANEGRVIDAGISGREKSFGKGIWNGTDV